MTEPHELMSVGYRHGKSFWMIRRVVDDVREYGSATVICRKDAIANLRNRLRQHLTDAELSKVEFRVYD